MSPMSIRPKGKAKDIFDNIMGRKEVEKNKVQKKRNKKEENGSRGESTQQSN